MYVAVLVDAVTVSPRRRGDSSLDSFAGKLRVSKATTAAATARTKATITEFFILSAAYLGKGVRGDRDIFSTDGDYDKEEGDGGNIARRRKKDDDDDDDDDAAGDAAFRERQRKISAELDGRTGRLWTEKWTITDEEWMADETWDDIEDWNPGLATRKSLESVRVYSHPPDENEDGNGTAGVPTLAAMSRLLTLPKSAPPHPGHGNPASYASHRRRTIGRRLRASIQVAISDDLLWLTDDARTHEERQGRVDDLYETIEERVREREPVLGKLPDFAKLVEGGLEDVLTMVRDRMTRSVKAERRRKAEEAKEAKEAGVGGGGKVDGAPGGKKVHEGIVDVMGVNEEAPVPIFMDVLAETRRLQQQQRSRLTKSVEDDEDGTSVPSPVLPEFFSRCNDDGVPNLLYPLNVHPKDGVGRMVEEWQLAANKETKRIMMRDAMREIASIVIGATTAGAPAAFSGTASAVDGSDDLPDDDDDVARVPTTGAARVFVTGKRGVGKTATLAGIVASARLSGHIVVYHPDGDRLRKHGYYIEPCPHRPGLYNLPEIAKEFCDQLLRSHGEDLSSPAFAGVVVSRAEMSEFFSDDQVRRLFRRAHAEMVASGTTTEEEVSRMTDMSLDRLLAVGVNSSSLSSGCYSAVISKLMTQTVRPFTVVMDEYNCYYDHGHYFHMDYDESVRKGVPPNRITIFKPFMDAMGLYPDEAGTDMGKTNMTVDSMDAMMRWGSIIVGTSESRAVRRSFTRSLEDCARALSSRVDGNDTPTRQRHPVHVVEVRRYNSVEVQHVLYNFEVTGIGRLRFDRGDTALNPEEVEYLRLVSGGCGQQLFDSCMLP
ncbi:hypothetical protein ACHAW5_002673 [Stephanodiscus triporus]|uniref:Small ribosomal subunit protein mS29 n=1 Tax=Stephanodiscus triporus TaxID=2934178 RepID=A0ABD3N2D9_9STRA